MFKGVMVPLIVAREAQDAADLARELGEHGIVARGVAIIDRVAIPGVRWADVAGPRLFLVTSVGSVDAVAPRVGDRVAAVGPRTAQALRDRGVVVDLEVEGGSVALAEAVVRAIVDQGWPPSVRWPTSDLGLGTPEHRAARAILEAVASVEAQAVYRTVLRSDVGALAEEIGPGPFHVLVASPSAVGALANLREARPDVDLRYGFIIGGSTNLAWVSAFPGIGFTRLIGTSPPEMARTIREIQDLFEQRNAP